MLISADVILPLRESTHPNLPSLGKECSTLGACPLPFEGADLRTDGSPDSEQTEPTKP